MRSVAIIDYGLGNITSVKNALSIVDPNLEVFVVGDKNELDKATHIILPGVGAFGDGMQGLKGRGLVPVLTESVMTKKKPLLGICLGMQLLASEGCEYGRHVGLDFIAGSVKQIDVSGTSLRLPHIGWNDVIIGASHTLTKGLDKKPLFYFVHGYKFVSDCEDVVVATVEYGESFPSIIQKGNICGVQFHPEKSHTEGILLLKNFLTLD